MWVSDDILKMNKWAHLQWDIGTPQKKKGGTLVVGTWLEAGWEWQFQMAASVL